MHVTLNIRQGSWREMAAAHLIAAEELLNPAPQSAVELFLCILALIPYDANTLSGTWTQVAYIELLQDMSAKQLSQLKVLHMDGIFSLKCILNTLQPHIHTKYVLSQALHSMRILQQMRSRLGILIRY
jgi:hypothetical protein